jgi:hypothetical protein
LHRLSRFARCALHFAQRIDVAKRPCRHALIVRVFINASRWMWRLDRRGPDKVARSVAWLREFEVLRDIGVSTQGLVDEPQVQTQKLMGRRSRPVDRSARKSASALERHHGSGNL